MNSIKAVQRSTRANASETEGSLRLPADGKRSQVQAHITLHINSMLALHRARAQR